MNRLQKAFFALLILNILDTLSTFVGIGLLGPEAELNPILVFWINLIGVIPVLVWKGISISLLAVAGIDLLGRRTEALSSTPVWVATMTLVAFYVLVVALGIGSLGLCFIKGTLP